MCIQKGGYLRGKSKIKKRKSRVGIGGKKECRGEGLGKKKGRNDSPQKGRGRVMVKGREKR